MVNYNGKSISNHMKLRILGVTAFNTVLYECETWTHNKEIRDKLLAFEMHCYRRILRVSWTERKTNREICDKLGIERDLLQRAMLKHLHWLPIEQRIKFKLATLTHNTLCSIQPAYLHSLLNYHTPTRSLRSANANLLSVPRVRTTFASRGFSVAAPAIWNSLPFGIRDSSSIHTFRRLLKTHCFQQAFGQGFLMCSCAQIVQL